MKPEDKAQELELAEWEARQEMGRLPKPTRKSALKCIEPGCGVRIPAARRKAVPGVQYCVECEEWNAYMRERHAAN